MGSMARGIITSLDTRGAVACVVCPTKANAMALVFECGTLPQVQRDQKMGNNSNPTKQGIGSHNLVPLTHV